MTLYDELEMVIFHWSRKHGDCYECGLPAAFQSPDAYDGKSPGPLLCAVCAANAAVDGERIVRIEEEERR